MAGVWVGSNWLRIGSIRRLYCLAVLNLRALNIVELEFKINPSYYRSSWSSTFRYEHRCKKTRPLSLFTLPTSRPPLSVHTASGSFNHPASMRGSQRWLSSRCCLLHGQIAGCRLKMETGFLVLCSLCEYRKFQS